MDEAIVVFSRKGIFQTTIAARDVRSREHARKLWPLVSPGASRRRVGCAPLDRLPENPYPAPRIAEAAGRTDQQVDGDRLELASQSRDN